MDDSGIIEAPCLDGRATRGCTYGVLTMAHITQDFYVVARVALTSLDYEPRAKC